MKGNMPTQLVVDRVGSVATVTIDVPPVNIVDADLYVELRQCFEDLGRDPSVRAVILTGAGRRAFCAGNSLDDFVKLDERTAVDYLMNVRACFNAVYECSAPVVGAINGPALGTGLVLASVCDIRLASTTSTFALPEIDVGILGGQRHLMRIAPQGLTRRMALTGERLNAHDALAAGLVEALHEPEDLMAAAFELANTLAAKSPVAMRLAKISLNLLERMELREGYEFECDLSATLRQFSDASKAAAAIRSKESIEFSPPEGWEHLLRVMKARS
jgi:enoyl-CoA hydratase